jgi:hypothetical protein
MSGSPPENVIETMKRCQRRAGRDCERQDRGRAQALIAFMLAGGVAKPKMRDGSAGGVAN